MRRHRCLFQAPVVFCLAAGVTSFLPAAWAQSPAGTPQSIEQKLSSQYTITKATADHSDVVTAGAVLVLKKDGLMMISTSSSVPSGNTYKDGKIAHGAWKMARVPGLGGMFSKTGDASDVHTRTFVSGEKFWVTKITVHDDGIVFDLLSDPFSDVRYYSTLKFPFSTKGLYPSDDDAAKTVAEVLDIAPQDNGGDQGQQTAAAGQGQGQGGAPAPPQPAPPAPQPAATMAPIAPPPPPSDTPPPPPKTITLKETKEQVVATFGQPTRVVKLATKEIDYYPDMKVTFVNDKVTDVQ